MSQNLLEAAHEVLAEATVRRGDIEFDALGGGIESRISPVVDYNDEEHPLVGFETLGLGTFSSSKKSYWFKSIDDRLSTKDKANRSQYKKFSEEAQKEFEKALFKAAQIFDQAVITELKQSRLYSAVWSKLFLLTRKNQNNK